MNRNEPHAVVVRLSALGDVVLTTGVLRYWQAARGLTFTVITRAAFAPVFSGHPAVREVIALSDAELRGPALRRRWRELAAAHAGQGLIDLHGTGRTRLLGFFWQGPVWRYPKLAFARRLFLASRGRLCRAGLASTTVSQRYALALEKKATLPLPADLLPQLYLTDDEAGWGAEAAAAARGGASRLIALHPFAAHAGKIWPQTHWQELARQLEARKLGWCVIGQGEVWPGIPPERNFVNRCTIRESAALLASCAALVTGDSGPMHLASSVGTPVVALFGSTSREWGFYPAGPNDRVLERELPCRPCALHGAQQCTREYACLRDILPVDVMAALHGM